MTGVYCMQQMGRSYEDKNVKLSADLEFFQKVLATYLPFCEENREYITVNDNDKKYFDALIELYSISKSKTADEWNEEESMADSLAFYISNGLVKRTNTGTYYINIEGLKKKLVEYSDYKEKMNAEVKTRGTKK